MDAQTAAHRSNAGGPPTEPLWSAIRRRLSPELTTGKLRNIQGEISSKSKQCVKRIKIDMEKYKQVNIRMMFTDFSTDVIGNLSFGVNSDATLTGESPLRTVTKDFMKFSLFRGFGWCCIFFIPELVDVFGFTMFPKRATSYLKEVYQKILAQRGGYDVNIDEGKDIFDALRKIKQESDMNKEDLPEKVLIAQAAAFLQGGFDATGTALAFCVYELAFQPDLQEKVYHEIVKIKQSIEDNDFDMDILKTATYLNCVVKETLRKYSSMGWLDRIAAKDYKIDDNLTIAAGTPVYVNAVGIHFDPDYYKDPNKFDPDRFLPDNEKRMKPFTYLPFGEGVRSCIGEHLAIQTMTFVLAHVLLNYKILPKKNAELPSKIGFQKYGLLIGPGQNLYVDFITRD
ncbi:cytochrome P450 6k1-like [Battus philenor]|uniref:cytochrome P450 6k1-like n=1 Tax=Battus philenor TaxID=42288 RepID=UPI0035CE961E